MFIPDNLGEVEWNEGWLHPLETPIPTPSLFPRPQNQSKFSLRRLGEANPFHFDHYIIKAKFGSGKEQRWVQSTKHYFVSKTWETPTGLRLFSGTSAQLDLNLTLTLTSLFRLSNTLLDTFQLHSDSNEPWVLTLLVPELLSQNKLSLHCSLNPTPKAEILPSVVPKNLTLEPTPKGLLKNKTAESDLLE